MDNTRRNFLLALMPLAAAPVMVLGFKGTRYPTNNDNKYLFVFPHMTPKDLPKVKEWMDKKYPGSSLIAGDVTNDMQIFDTSK